MFKMIPWSSDLDLTEFYETATKKGFINNSSQKMLVNCFDNEREKQVWILYNNDIAIGSVAAHSLDFFGENSYRICARTCTFSESRSSMGLITARKLILHHQNYTHQFFIPECINWAGKDKDLYISSHESTVASHRLVHTIYCPLLTSAGLLEKTAVVEYRGTVQTFWRLNVEKFLEDIERYPKWQYHG